MRTSIYLFVSEVAGAPRLREHLSASEWDAQLWTRSLSYAKDGGVVLDELRARAREDVGVSQE